MVDRRRFLTGIVSASTLAIAGCSSEDIESGDDEESTPSEGPEEVVRNYFSAINRADAESANSYLHPDSPITSTEELVSGVEQGAEIDLSEVEVTQKNEQVAYVDVVLTSRIERSSQETSGTFTLQIHDDQWKIYDDEEPEVDGESRENYRLRIEEVVGSATDDGAIDSIEIVLRLNGGSEPVNVENATFIIESENSRAEISGERSTSGVEYRSGQSLSDGETTLREQDEILIAELDLTETSVSNFEPNQQPEVLIQFQDIFISMKGLTIPDRLEGGSSYLIDDYN